MEDSSEKITRDQLLFKEFVTVLVVILLILWAALFFPAPLSIPGGEIVPAGSPVKAPWIFLAVQTLFVYLPPFLGGIIVPSGAFLVLALFPWDARVRKGSMITWILFAGLILCGFSLTIYGFLMDPRIP